MNVKELTEKIWEYCALPVNPLGQNTTKSEWFKSIEALLTEAIERAKFDAVQDYTSKIDQKDSLGYLAIGQAVAQERELCAKVAEDRMCNSLCPCCTAEKIIAAQIRERGTQA